ncbi:MAG: response regulator transcription factor [Candidatus Kapabacteria bacterium]|nr:response regulator transcription factor [Candidatus Kapabacteria bacterium]
MPYRDLPILVVGGDARSRHAFLEYFQRNGLFGIEAESCSDAMKIMTRRTVNMAILDWDLPDNDAAHFASFVRSTDPLIPIIGYSEDNKLDKEIEAMSHGIDDFWHTSIPLIMATMKCRAMLRRSMAIALTEAPFQLGGVTIDLRKRLVWRDEMATTLKEKEFGIIRTLALEDGAPVRRETLIARVWGFDAPPATRTVDNYIVSLRRKIEHDPSEPQFLLTVGGIGYRLNL